MRNTVQRHFKSDLSRDHTLSDDTDPARLPWNHRFAALGPQFSTPTPATPLPTPYWIAHNDAIAAQLQLPAHWHQSERFLQALSGNMALDSSCASVYSGHQFGAWAGQLGDGRALLLGDLQGLEVQLKGAGRTPFSRGADGRAVLRSTIREYLCCQAMRGLAIPSTDALCITGSPATVQRERMETAAVLTRVAPSFVRFGHFEHFSFSQQLPALKILADHVIDQFYPACRDVASHGGNAYAQLLEQVCTRSAHLVAQWQAVGFCHGVLNTDNMSILGQTLDYGPFQFLDAYVLDHICNHSDHHGRYRFDAQPDIVFWNLQCLAQALLPLIGSIDPALDALSHFSSAFGTAYRSHMARKLGTDNDPTVPWGGKDGVDVLLLPLLDLLASQRVDYTLFWRHLSHWVAQRTHAADVSDDPLHALFQDPAPLDAWLLRYQEQVAGSKTDWQSRGERMLDVNPKFILRNHTAERAIRAAAQGDFTVIAQIQEVLAQPCAEHPQAQELAELPPAWAADLVLSCSS